MATVWIQIFHLPMELCTDDILEMVASQFGRVLKVDDHSLYRSRVKFARVCVDVDLSQPLQLGTWVNYGLHSVFVLVLYEKLPFFVTGVEESIMARLIVLSPAFLCSQRIVYPPNHRFKGR